MAADPDEQIKIPSLASLCVQSKVQRVPKNMELGRGLGDF